MGEFATTATDFLKADSLSDGPLTAFLAEYKYTTLFGNNAYHMNSNKNRSNQMFIFDERRKPHSPAGERSLNAELRIAEKNINIDMNIE